VRIKATITVRCAQASKKGRSLTKYGASSRFIARKIGAAKATFLAKAVENFEAVWRGKHRLSPSRYSDGSYRVLYTATKPEVAKAERFYRLIEWFKTSGTPSVSDFFIYSCNVKGKCINFTKNWKKNKKLVHPKKYDYCQSLGERARKSGADYILVPSARKLGGCCVPIFTKGSVAVTNGSASFDVHWDKSVRKCYTVNVKRARQYTAIDKVFGLV
jgi:RES domain-containing protein